MHEVKKHGYGQNIELMRRSTPARMQEQKVWSEEEVVCLRSLFYTHEGISHMSLLFGVTEIEVMRKILELGLYNTYSFPLYYNYFGDTPNSPEEELEGGYNCDPYTKSVERMRRATATFREDFYLWSETHSEILKEMFQNNSDITTIALSFMATEPLILRKIVELGLYSNYDISLFGTDLGPYVDTVRYYTDLGPYIWKGEDIK